MAFALKQRLGINIKRKADYLSNQITDKCSFAIKCTKNSPVCIDGIQLKKPKKEQLCEYNQRMIVRFQLGEPKVSIPLCDLHF
jgi:hypothetical protein